jgi:hypothetical protein
LSSHLTSTSSPAIPSNTANHRPKLCSLHLLSIHLLRHHLVHHHHLHGIAHEVTVAIAVVVVVGLGGWDMLDLDLRKLLLLFLHLDLDWWLLPEDISSADICYHLTTLTQEALLAWVKGEALGEGHVFESADENDDLRRIVVEACEAGQL